MCVYRCDIDRHIALVFGYGSLCTVVFSRPNDLTTAVSVREEGGSPFFHVMYVREYGVSCSRTFDLVVHAHTYIAFYGSFSC